MRHVWLYSEQRNREENTVGKKLYG